jgi:hypothetical protein
MTAYGRHRCDRATARLRVLKVKLFQKIGWRWLGAGCLGLLLAAGLGAWAARDLPRRVLAAYLSDRLAARVRLERLEILTPDRFLLAGLSMSRLRDYPFVETLELDELVVEGSLRGMLQNRFDRLRLRGLVVRLAPAPAVTPPDQPLPEIGEVVLEPASIRVAAGADREDLQLCLEAVVRDVGGRAHGELRLSAPALELAPLQALTGTAEPPAVDARVEELTVRLAFDGDDGELDAGARQATLEAGGGRLEVSRPHLAAVTAGPVTVVRFGGERATAAAGDRPASVEAPSAEATIIESDGLLRVELVPWFAWLGDGRLVADWDPVLEVFSSLEARLRGIDVQRLLPDAGLAATADATLRRAGDRLEVRLDLVPADLVLAGDRELRAMAGSTVHVSASVPFEPVARFQMPTGGTLDVAIDLATGRGRWGSLSLPPAALPLSAGFEGRWQSGETLAVDGSYRLESPAAGRLAADGEVTVADGAASADVAWSWAGVDLERLIGLLRAAGLSMPELELRGGGEARGRLRGPLDAGTPAVQGTIALRGLEAAPPSNGQDGPRLTGGEATADLVWAGGGADLELARLELSGTVATSVVEPLALALEASGRLDPDLASGRLEATVRASDPGLGSAQLSGNWRRRADSSFETSARMSLEDLDLGRWQGIATLPAGAATDYQLKGIAGAALSGSLSGDSWHLTGPVHLESAGFSSTDGSRVTEGLDSRWDVAVQGGAGVPIEAEGRGRLGGFLLLWNTFYGDFSQVEASAEWRARLQPVDAGARPWRLEVEAALPGGPNAAITLESGGEAWRYTLSLDERDLAATHQRYLAPLLEERLGDLELGGELSARVRGSYRADGEAPAWSLIGDVRARGLRLESGGGQASVSGLDLDLPLDLRRRPVAELDFSGPRLSGRLGFERLTVRGLELPPIETDLAVEADSVGLEKPIVLSVLGGAVHLDRLTLRHLLRPGRHLESGVELSGIRLETLSDQLGLIPLEGAVNGRLAGVRLSPAKLSVDGGGQIEVFGGSVEVRDISGEDVLSRFPKITLSADFHDLDLGALTRRFDFGEMTGTLEGSLEDCELFRGVPVRFSARLETVHRKGVPRTVDVKAVNNITILGTGQRTNIFDRGIQRFFNRYTYDRLGVTMRLDKDVLLLRGLEHRGERELFLRGRLPFRIDVVNAQPGKTVSFQTMVGRLRSLDFGNARTER